MSPVAIPLFRMLFLKVCFWTADHICCPSRLTLTWLCRNRIRCRGGADAAGRVSAPAPIPIPGIPAISVDSGVPGKSSPARPAVLPPCLHRLQPSELLRRPRCHLAAFSRVLARGLRPGDPACRLGGVPVSPGRVRGKLCEQLSQAGEVRGGRQHRRDHPPGSEPGDPMCSHERGDGAGQVLGYDRLAGGPAAPGRYPRSPYPGCDQPAAWLQRPFPGGAGSWAATG